MNRIRLVLSIVTLVAATAHATPTLHLAASWPLVWSPAGSETTVPRLDLEFGAVGGRTLRLDAWAPAGPEPSARRPAVVFLGGPADSPSDPMRRWPIYQSWMRAVAARGLVGVMADVEPSAPDASFAALFRFLAEHGGDLGVDPSRLALVALSANVRAAFPFAMADAAPAGLRAAAFLYGTGSAPRIRTDLPVFFVVAGKDAPGLVAAAKSLETDAEGARAPWIFVHALDVPHAFDALDRGANSRALVQQTLDFLGAQLAEPAAPEPEPARSARDGLAALYGRDFERAREIYERLSGGPGASDPLVWKNLAWACEGSGDATSTLRALDRALALDPDDRVTLRATGLAAARLGDWERTDRTLSGLGEPLDPIAREMLGVARLRLGRPAEAVPLLERAVAERGFAETRYNLACALALSGDREGALRELERAVADGYLSPELATDPDLETLREDPRFRKVLEQMPVLPDENEADHGAPH